MTTIDVHPLDENVFDCDCCGESSKTIWGDLSILGGVCAVYYVQWTPNKPNHYPNFDLIIGPWGEGTASEHRNLVSLIFQPSPDGGSFMIIDSTSRPANKKTVCGKALKRDDVINTPLAKEIFNYIDVIWLKDPRLEGIKQLNELS